MSDRELERHLLRNPHMAGALGFDKVPSHQTFSHFKQEHLTVEPLEEIFNSLRDHLVNKGIIDFRSITMDSASINAFVNIAKANQEVKMDDSMALALFNDETYQFLAKRLIASLGYKRSLLKHVQKRLTCLNICLNMMVLYE